MSKNNNALPAEARMWDAIVARDASFEGVFFTAVRTTGVFCRPGCPARIPKRENVAFFATAGEALAAGYRPCKRCRPLEPRGVAPAWLRGLLDRVETDPTRRVTDTDIRAWGVDPGRVRRWFVANHGITFHAYLRARRLGIALGRIQCGVDATGVAFDVGYESVSAFRDAFGHAFGKTPARGKHATLVTMNRLLTPLGPMVVAAVDAGICLLEFADRRMLETQLDRLRRHLDAVFAPGEHRHFGTLQAELSRYFAGEPVVFETPIVAPGSAFQTAVWRELRGIPRGETRAYDDLANALGKPGASRAVGRANGDNRIGIVIPCHRVIRRDGTLGGYGGGLWRKQRLLEIEGWSATATAPPR